MILDHILCMRLISQAWASLIETSNLGSHYCSASSIWQPRISLQSFSLSGGCDPIKTSFLRTTELVLAAALYGRAVHPDPARLKLTWKYKSVMILFLDFKIFVFALWSPWNKIIKSTDFWWRPDFEQKLT